MTKLGENNAISTQAKPRFGPSDDRKDPPPSEPANGLIYITGEGCHLCEYGRAVLGELGIAYREISASSDEALQLASGGLPLAFLPVLVDRTRLIAMGRFSLKRLRLDLGL